MTKTIICELISGCCDELPVGELNNDFDGSWAECHHCGEYTTFHCIKLEYGHSCERYWGYNGNELYKPQHLRTVGVFTW